MRSTRSPDAIAAPDARWAQPVKTRPRPTLGAVAIAFNEERDLGGFLDNLEGWVDEIVIVDDGSTDRTEAIARDAGPHVRFLRSPRRRGEYFSHQRNKGIAAAKSDWLLHMDVDERATPELALEIRRAIERTDRDGYRFRRLNHFLHRPLSHGGWGDWNLVHLARRRALSFGGMFHEDCLVDAPPERIGQLSNRMIHLNEESFEKRLRKSGAYLEEAAARVERRGRPPGWTDIAGRPVREFLWKYLARGGFRDGVPGLIAAMHSATAVFRANALVWDRRNRIEREALEAQVAALWTAKLRAEASARRETPGAGRQRA